MIDRVLNFDDPTLLLRMIPWLKTLKGKKRLILKEHRLTRSNRQNSYMWAAVLPAVQRGCEDLWGETVPLEEIHHFLKARFLGRDIVDPSTGETYRVPRESTTQLTTVEFCNYIDQITKFAGEYLFVEVPSPLMYGIEREQQRKSA